MPTFVIILIVAGALLVVVLSIVLVWRVRVYNKKYRELTAKDIEEWVRGGGSIKINPQLGVEEQVDLLPYDKNFEFSLEKLKFGKQLGSGAFGRVVKAKAYGISKLTKHMTPYSFLKLNSPELTSICFDRSFGKINNCSCQDGQTQC